MDTWKIAPGWYQYMSVDDCTRYRVLRLYSRRTANNTLDFIDCVIDEMRSRFSEFRRIEARILCQPSSIKTNEKESNFDLTNQALPSQWQGRAITKKQTNRVLYDYWSYWPEPRWTACRVAHYYNWDRPHSAHNGKSRWKIFWACESNTILRWSHKKLHQTSERMQDANYMVDLALRKLKRSLWITQ